MSHSQWVLLLLFGSGLVAACGPRAPQVPTDSSQASPPSPIEAAKVGPEEVEPAKIARAEAAPLSWDASTQIGDIVAREPETARLFELLDIDYCCGGKQTLAEAAKGRSLDVGRLVGALQAMRGGPARESKRDWLNAPLDELVEHIVSTYHVRLRRDLPRLDALVSKVVRVHGESHTELEEVGRHFAALHKAIVPHLVHEETQLFPAILATPPRAAAGTQRLLEQMRAEHDEVGGALHRIRELTRDYKLPEDACPLYAQMLKGLEALEHDLHAHVHLENNVLLPRSMAMLKGS